MSRNTVILPCESVKQSCRNPELILSKFILMRWILWTRCLIKQVLWSERQLTNICISSTAIDLQCQRIAQVLMRTSKRRNPPWDLPSDQKPPSPCLRTGRVGGSKIEGASSAHIHLLQHSGQHPVPKDSGSRRVGELVFYCPCAVYALHLFCRHFANQSPG